MDARNGIALTRLGVAMRSALWTVFLVVALQGIASASSAFASPMDENTSRASADVPSATEAVDAEGSKAQTSPRTDFDRKSRPSQQQVLSKNLQSPRPMQIYWFFGGR